MEDVRIADLRTFLAVHRTGSISAASRQLRTTPSQVSKAIVRLEGHAGVRLFTRSSKGIGITAAGLELVPRVLAAIESVQSIRRGRAKQPSAPVDVTIVAPSYLAAQVVPVIATCHPQLRVRTMEMAPARLRAALSDNLFDMALVPGTVERLPAAWKSEPVGVLHFGLLASKATAARLEPLPATLERVRALPFIVPLAPTDRVAPLEDDCPLPRAERQIGHESETINAAMELAAASGQLVFGPLLAGRRLLESGALVEIPVEGWHVRQPLNLLCNESRVLELLRRNAVRALRAYAR